MQTTLLKKLSPSGEIMLYIAQRDFVDHYNAVDPVDGVVIVPLSKAHGRRLFVEIQLQFRYGAEADEFVNIPFKKTVVVAACELFPFHNSEQEPIQMSNWQTALSRKFGNSEGICPFRLNFPQGSPPSLVVAGPSGVGGEPCGLTYQIVAYFATDLSLPLQKRNTVGFNIRVMQECLSLPVLEQLSLAPTARPATLVARQFFLSPGRLQIEMCLDRPVVYYGDKVAMHVVISNSSTRTIRKIKCKIYQVSQLSFTPGERRAPIYELETMDGCPIPPGASLQRSYTLWLKLQPHRSRENLVYEAPAHNQATERLSATTIFPYTDPKEGFAILVSYEAKIKAYLGSVPGLGDVSARVPFFVLHPPPDVAASNGDDDDGGEVHVPISKPVRMVRLTSVENQLTNEEQDQPLLII